MAMQSGFIKRIRDIMRMDAGINGDAQRIEQMVWMLFLKVYDAKEDDWELNEDNYESIIPEDLRWRNWAKADSNGHAMTGDKLLNFVNNTLFPALKGNDVKEGDKVLYEGIKVTPDTPIKKAIVKSTFEDANNYMKEGVYLRQVIDVIDEIEFDDVKESHAFGFVYEEILRELQSAGSSGEFYTPRAVTEFMALMIKPQLGEKMADFACGTGGFITSWLGQLARTGGTVGKSYIVKEIPEEAIYAGYLIRTRYSDMLCPEYLYYFMQTHLYWTQLRNGTIATAQPNCNGQTLSKMILPLPPLAEQKRIVAKLEELLPLVDRYAVAYEKLEQVNAKFPDDMKKSILQYAIQGKLVEQRAEEGTGEELYQQIQAEKQRLIAEKKIKKEKPLPEIAENEKPYDIPDNWTWVRFGDLGSYKKGPFGSAITKSMFVPKGNGAIKVYEQKNAIQKDATLGDYYIRRDYFESKMKGFEVFPGDIIVSCAGTIGETYVMPDKFEQGIINQALMRMKIFEPLYIPYFLTFFDFVLKKNARSGSKGSAIKNIPPFEILKNYLVPIPPLAEQRRIVAKLEEILPLCERLK